MLGQAPGNPNSFETALDSLPGRTGDLHNAILTEINVTRHLQLNIHCTQIPDRDSSKKIITLH